MKKIALLLASLSVLVGCANSQPSACVDKADVVEDVIMGRRSIRSYRQTPVGRDTLNRILKAGINAPNGQNKQSWEIRVVDNPETMKKVYAAVDSINPDMPGASSSFRGAPVMVFIAQDPSYDFSAIDCGLLSENIMLSAWSMGVGSICLGSPVRFFNGPEASQNPQMKEVTEMLGFSEGYRLIICIGLGYPAESPDAKPRDEAKIRFVE